MDDSAHSMETQGSSDLDLAQLKERATLMGIPFSNSIKAATLAKKIQDRLDGADMESNLSADQLARNRMAERNALYTELRRNAEKLTRIRVTCMNPQKAGMDGEIIVAGNRVIGTHKKFVPYGEKGAAGWHVTQPILKALKRKKYLQIRTKTNQRGQIDYETRWVPEYAVEILPPLTKAEMDRLGSAQLASGIMDFDLNK